jgi:glycerophosphoryl diester phosphodiesterase
VGTAPGERPARRIKGRRVLIAALVSVFLGVATVWGIVETEDLEDPIKVTAHRGSSSTAPENTLAAVRQAVADGADFVEIDVQLTRDGVVVVAHDADLMRLAGDPRVLTQSSFAELREVDVGSWFGPEFASQRLPTLDEVIAAVRGRSGLLVEIKSYRADGLVLVAKVVEALRAQGMSDTAAIMSLDYAEVSEARRLAPEIPAGFVASATIGRVDRLDVEFLAVPASRTRSVLIAAAHQQQKQVWVWTVNDREQMWRLIDYGVDSIITDEPATLREVLRERETLDDVERLLLRFRHFYIN